MSTQRRAANECYDHTPYGGLNDQHKGAIVLIMHRLPESVPSGVTRGDDLAGHVLAQEPWQVVRLPSIADEDELHRVKTNSPPSPTANHLIRAGSAVAGYADLEAADFPVKLAPGYMGAD
jgi:hypothetical protein